MKTIKLGLTDNHIEGMPELDGVVFSSLIDNITNVDKMDKVAADIILPMLNIKPMYRSGLACSDFKSVTFLTSDKGIELYVTGPTFLTSSIIKLAANKGIPLTLWHFNHITLEFFPQVIFPQTKIF